MSTAKTALANLDASRYEPFQYFNNYYIKYSTWLGAAFMPASIFLLVVFGGSDFGGWILTPDLESTTTVAQDNTTIPFPYMGMSVFPKFAFDTILSGSFNIESSSNITGLFDDTYFTYEFYECRRTRFTTETFNATQGTTSYEYTLEQFCDPTPLTKQTSCTTPTQSLTVPGVCVNPTNVILQGDDSARFVRYIEMRLYRCTNGSSCQSTSAFTSTVGGSRLVFASAVDVPEDLFDQQELTPLVQYWHVGMDVTAHTIVTARIRPLDIKINPTFSLFQSVERYRLPYMTRPPDVTYAPPHTSGDGLFLTVQFVLDSKYDFLELFPITILDMLARLGAVVATLFVATFFVKRFNFLTFYTLADERYYVPDVVARKFLMKNKTMEISEFENKLMYAFSFGQPDRFGVQTQHVYDYFFSPQKRFAAGDTAAIVDDLSTFLAQSRLEQYVNEQARVGRSVEYQYHLGALKKKEMQDELEENLNEYRRKQGLNDDPEALQQAYQYNDDVDPLLLAEIDTTTKLSTLYDEIQKVASITALLYPVEASEFGLIPKLQNIRYQPRNYVSTVTEEYKMQLAQRNKLEESDSDRDFVDVLDDGGADTGDMVESDDEAEE